MNHTPSSGGTRPPTPPPLPVSGRLPVVQAPMAGGVAGPTLATAVAAAGGTGFLAAGYKSAHAMGDEIDQVRAAGVDAFGVNLFLPQRAMRAERDKVPGYRASLAVDAARLEAPLGTMPAGAHDDDYTAKVDLLLTTPVPLVTFTFGSPEPTVLAALHAAGTATAVTVTSVEEARQAAAAGPSALVVQGAEAGGHQATFDNTGIGQAAQPLAVLLPRVRAVTNLPLVAAGGIHDGQGLARVLAAGAMAAQLGTLFLRCTQSTAPAAHKQALTDPSFTTTTLSRAFSGRLARGLTNRFIAEHGSHAPAAYPEVHYLTLPLRRAAAAGGDVNTMALWAGQGWRHARAEDAADTLVRLARELDDVRHGEDR